MEETKWGMMTVSQGHSSFSEWKSGCMEEMMVVVVGMEGVGDLKWGGEMAERNVDRGSVTEHCYGNIWEHFETVMPTKKNKNMKAQGLHGSGLLQDAKHDF